MRVDVICKRNCCPVNYIRWLKVAGIEPIVISRFSDIKKAIACDGLLFPGGGDVKPYFFGKTGIGNDFDLYRDALELVLFKQNTDKAILGICRGAQSINVFCGGTVKDIGEAHFNVFHTFEGTSEKVFSLHRQAIDSLADGFTVIKKIGDVIEEAHDSRKILVQFHPERTRNSRVLFLFKHL